MKRFREIIEESRRRYPDDNFFANFEMKCQDNLFRRYYDVYNKALMSVGDESWNILKEKALRHFRHHREGQKKQGFFNILNEAFAYKFLSGRGFQNITFFKEEQKKRTADITFYMEGDLSYCEVKTIGISEEEIENREKSPFSIDDTVYERLNEKFFNKLSNTINSAKQQMSASEINGLIFIVIVFDDPFQINYSTYKEQLIKFCRDQKYENLIIKIGYFENELIFLK